jgi:Tfp pilus assembly protein PilF
MSSYSRSLFTASRRSVLSVASTFITLLFLLTICRAQGSAGVNATNIHGNEEIAGRIFFPPGDRSTARPLVRLQSLSSPEETGVTDRDGNFRFTHLRPDAYTIIVDGGDAYETAADTVIIGNSGPVPAQGNPGQYAAASLVYQVQIYLRPKRTSGIANKPEELNTALAEVPATARDLFNKALEYARDGNRPKAIELLQSATAYAPKFTLAYNELGVQFLKSGRADKAAEAFKEALAITPSDFTLCLNYGVALLNLKRFGDAETQLRFAIQRNAASPVAHYYLGLALMNEQKFAMAQAEFESTIKNGGARLALAHKYLGGVYWRNNHYQQAADELEKYVRLEPKAPDVKKIRETIRDLRNRG